MEDVQVVAMLVRRCIAGDAAAWEEIVQTYNRRIYNICYRFAGSSDDAQDLTQEVFIKMYRTLSSYDPEQGRVRDLGDDHNAEPAGGPFPQDQAGPDDRFHGHRRRRIMRTPSPSASRSRTSMPPRTPSVQSREDSETVHAGLGKSSPQNFGKQ